MISERELADAIYEVESEEPSMRNCEKLSALYSVYDHNYRQASDFLHPVETVAETIIDTASDTDFLQAVNGRRSEDVWKILGECMQLIQLLQPRLYNAVLTKLNSLTKYD